MKRIRPSGICESPAAAANLGGAQVELTADDIRDINGAVSQIEVHGARYPEAAQRLVGR